MTTQPMPTTEAEAMTEHERTGWTARQRVDVGESPFRVHASKVLGCYSTAYRLQALVLSLYNSTEWHKKAPVHLDNLLANADEDHVNAAIDMLRSYAKRGERDPDFLALGMQLAKARIRSSQRRKGAA